MVTLKERSGPRSGARLRWLTFKQLKSVFRGIESGRLRLRRRPNLSNWLDVEDARTRKRRCILVPKFAVGDVVDVRERWRRRRKRDPVAALSRPGFTYQADVLVQGDDASEWRSALYLPKRGVRLFLRIERVHPDINVGSMSLAEAVAEGFGSRAEFLKAFRSMHGNGMLPPCWVLYFHAWTSPSGPLLENWTKLVWREIPKRKSR